jgi:hypothetical protein
MGQDSGVGTADLTQSLTTQKMIGVRRQIAERYDANQPLFIIEHGQAANLVFAHIASNIVGIIVFPAIEYFRCHDFFGCRCDGIMSAGNTADGDIPIRDHADQSVILDYHHATTVALLHFFSNLVQRRVGRDNFHVFAHDVLDFHFVVLSVNDEWLFAVILLGFIVDIASTSTDGRANSSATGDTAPGHDGANCADASADRSTGERALLGF